ncbi:hypothetical protein NDU88_002448 [Pleurodeles waltl]|uniref:Uncharacterized protein n=1 Tax=Pleurodeles waltl TaxID=8319 RepID=A0AAV7U9R1_PLEWA|nr:hypothetical protein NDU88_002448 [Pleurodeles waltl]
MYCYVHLYYCLSGTGLSDKSKRKACVAPTTAAGITIAGFLKRVVNVISIEIELAKHQLSLSSPNSVPSPASASASALLACDNHSASGVVTVIDVEPCTNAEESEDLDVDVSERHLLWGRAKERGLPVTAIPPEQLPHVLPHLLPHMRRLSTVYPSPLLHMYLSLRVTLRSPTMYGELFFSPLPRLPPLINLFRDVTFRPQPARM